MDKLTQGPIGNGKLMRVCFVLYSTLFEMPGVKRCRLDINCLKGLSNRFLPYFFAFGSREEK